MIKRVERLDDFFSMISGILPRLWALIPRVVDVCNASVCTKYMLRVMDVYVLCDLRSLYLVPSCHVARGICEQKRYA